MKKVCTHFFGFRGDEYNRAIKVFGLPDFIHPVHDRRAYVEIETEKDKHTEEENDKYAYEEKTKGNERERE